MARVIPLLFIIFSGYFISETWLLIDNNVVNHPLIMETSMGLRKEDFNNRIKRTVLSNRRGCPLPARLETARLDCTEYDIKIKCIDTCVWGHALSGGGTQKKYKCYYYNNTWLPGNFEECYRTVDCNIHLISPGNFSCVSNQVGIADYCIISCLPYDEFEVGLPSAKYECTLDGGWKPNLPYCAAKGYKAAKAAAVAAAAA